MAFYSRLDTAINAMNQISGVKYILKKFDNSPYIWFIVTPNATISTANTTGTLYIMDLDGNVISNNSLTGLGNYRIGAVIDNIAVIFSMAGSTYTNLALRITAYYYNSTSGLWTAKTSPISTYKYITAWSLFAYKDTTTSNHVFLFTGQYGASGSTYAAVGRDTPLQYTYETNSIPTSVEVMPAKTVIQFYHYEYTSSANAVKGLRFYGSSPYISITQVLVSLPYGNITAGNIGYTSSYAAVFFPIFYYTGSLSEVNYEMFEIDYSSTTALTTCRMMTGLDVEFPSSLGVGDAYNYGLVAPALSGSTYNIRTYGALIDVKCGISYVYTYNSTSENVELVHMYTPSNYSTRVSNVKFASFIGEHYDVSYGSTLPLNKLITKTLLRLYDVSTSENNGGTKCPKMRTLSHYTYQNTSTYSCVSIDFVASTSPDLGQWIAKSPNDIRSVEWDQTTGEGHIYILDTVNTLPENAFYNFTEMTACTIPSTIKTIKSNAFNGTTNLRSFDFCECSVVEDNAFTNCTNLMLVSFNPAINQLGLAFDDKCTNLHVVTYHGREANWWQNVYKKVNGSMITGTDGISTENSTSVFLKGTTLIIDESGYI